MLDFKSFEDFMILGAEDREDEVVVSVRMMLLLIRSAHCSVGECGSLLPVVAVSCEDPAGDTGVISFTERRDPVRDTNITASSGVTLVAWFV